MSSVYAFEPTQFVDVKGKDISWAKDGAGSNVRIINYGIYKKYFKECKKKVDLHFEVQRIVNDYFCECLHDVLSENRQLILDTLSDESNFEKFVNMGFLWDKKSNVSKHVRGEVDSGFLGINNHIFEKSKISSKDFFSYSSREFYTRQYSFNIEEGTFQTTRAMKSLGTYKLAQHLGIEDVIVKTEPVKLLTDYSEKFGILTDEADGVYVSELYTMELEISPKFQLELTNLQILDSITGEHDHNPSNYRIKVKGNKLIGVSAFDNEECFFGKKEDCYWIAPELTNLDLKKTGLCYNSISPIVTNDNKVNLPHMSRFLAEKILNTEDNDIDNILGDILAKEQIFSVKNRLKTLKLAIINTIKDNNDFLLSDEQWSYKTISKELSGDYGNTYLNYFCKTLYDRDV